MNSEDSTACYIASEGYRRFYRERHARHGINFIALMRPMGGGSSDACDAMNTAIVEAWDRHERPSEKAMPIFQQWIDGDIMSNAVSKQLTAPADVAIFRSAEVMWLDIGECYHD